MLDYHRETRRDCRMLSWMTSCIIIINIVPQASWQPAKFERCLIVMLAFLLISENWDNAPKILV
jgi:hypothetical protein